MVKSFSALAAASLIAAAVATPLEVAKRQTGTCSKLHVMAAGGCHLPCTSNTLSFLSTTVAGITNAVAGSDLWLVPYDGSMKQAAVSGPLLNQAIAQYTQDCPDTPIVLVGYSLGGIIVTNSMCGQVPYTKNIIASVTYGEETFAYPTSYDRGTCQANAPLYARNNTAACNTFAPVMRSYCDALDPNCCSTGNIADNSAHFQYPGKYDGEVASYVLSQYNAFIGPAARSSAVSSAGIAPATFSSMPFYGNSSIPASTATVPPVVPAPANTAANKGGVVTETVISSVPVTNGNTIVHSPITQVLTRTLTVTGTTTIPLYEATGLTTPVNPTETAVPNSAAAEPENAPSAGAEIVPVASGSGVALAPSVVLATSTVMVAPTADVPAGSAGSMPSGTLAPYNPNGASSLAWSGSVVGCAALVLGLLL